MVDFERLYTFLFNGITDVIRTMDEHNYGVAKDGLCILQQKAEDFYIRSVESSPPEAASVLGWAGEDSSAPCCRNRR